MRDAASHHGGEGIPYPYHTVAEIQARLTADGPTLAVFADLLRAILQQSGATHGLIAEIPTRPEAAGPLDVVAQAGADEVGFTDLRAGCETALSRGDTRIELPGEGCSRALRCAGRLVGAIGLASRAESAALRTLFDLCAMALATRHAERERDDAQDRRRAVLDAALDCVIVADHEGRVVEFSPVAEETFGWSREEALGKLLGELFIPEEMRAAHEAGMARFLSTGESRVLGKRIELEAIRADGERIPVELAIQVTQHEQGPLFTAYVRDITARHAAEQELREAKEIAEEASRAKSRFLASVSHEIRTPMTAILGYADMIGSGTLDEKNLNRLRRLVRQNANHLLSLVDDLLDVSRIESGKLPLIPKPMDVDQLVEDVAELFLERAEEKLLDLRIQKLTPLPRVLEIDGTRLRQILVNLVSNAIKFTETGQVEIRVAVERVSPEGQELLLHLAVEDTGQGIPESQHSLLFEPFVQLPGTDPESGSGMGLAIVKRLAKLLGGVVRLTSTPGRGSTFTVEVPAKDLARTDTAILEPSGFGDRAEHPQRLDGYELLVVDDNEDNRAIVTFLLEGLGATCAISRDGLEAVEHLRSAREAGRLPQLVLMDLQMPRMDGFEALRALRADGFDLPIIALTAFATATDRERAERAGFSDHATKPVRIKELTRSIRKLVPPPAAATTEGSSATPLHSALRDNPRFLPLLRKYLSNLTDLAEEIRSASVAGNHQQLEVLVHQIKGSGGGYGFPLLTERAAYAEQLLRDGEDATAAVEELIEAMRRAAAGSRSLPPGDPSG